MTHPFEAVHTLERWNIARGPKFRLRQSEIVRAYVVRSPTGLPIGFARSSKTAESDPGIELDVPTQIKLVCYIV